MKDSKKPATTTQSVTRALAILSCFSEQQSQLRVIDFAKKLNLTQSNISRLLTTMVSLGYVEKDGFSGSFRLGTEIISLAGIALNQSEWWERLSMDQKFGVYQLQKFGYDLAFIRNNPKGAIAVVRRGVEFATVNSEGDVDLNPDIVIRD